jgi:hypothetical protein
MRPVGFAYHSKKGWQIVHTCAVCGVQRRNKLATDTIQPDSVNALAKLN